MEAVLSDVWTSEPLDTWRAGNSDSGIVSVLALDRIDDHSEMVDHVSVLDGTVGGMGGTRPIALLEGWDHLMNIWFKSDIEHILRAINEAMYSTARTGEVSPDYVRGFDAALRATTAAFGLSSLPEIMPFVDGKICR